jgi:sodium-coupled neutral amino acid transporter 11
MRTAAVRGSPEQGTSQKKQTNETKVDDEDMTVVGADDPGTSTPFQTFLNLSNTIIGAGIIGVPYALELSGVLLGVALLLVVALVTDFSLRLLVSAGRLAGTETYLHLADTTYGLRGRVAASLAQGLFALGACLAYTLILGNTIPEALAYMFGWSSRSSRPVVILVTSVFCLTPLSLLKDLHRLAWGSLVSLTAVGFIILTVVADALSSGARASGDPGPVVPVGSHPLEAIGILAFAFVTHHNTHILAKTMKGFSEPRFATVVHWSIATALTVCLVLGLAGYLPHRALTSANILNNLREGALGTCARLLLALTMILTYPLELYVLRDVARAMVAPRDDPTRQLADRPFVLVTLAVVSFTTLVALATRDLGLVMELTGSVSATALGFILPSLFFLKAGEGKITRRQTLQARALLISGGLVLVVSTALALRARMG